MRLSTYFCDGAYGLEGGSGNLAGYSCYGKGYGKSMPGPTALLSSWSAGRITIDTGSNIWP